MKHLALALVTVLAVGVQCGVIDDVWNGMSDIAKSAWNDLSSGFKSAAGWIKEKINDARDLVDDKTDEEVKKGAAKLKTYLEGIKQVKSDIYNDQSSTGKAALDNIDTHLSKVTEIKTRLDTKTGEEFDTAKSDLKVAVTGMWSDLVEYKKMVPFNAAPALTTTILMPAIAVAMMH